MPTEWLKIMLEEIQRRREDARRAREEDDRRRQEQAKSAPNPEAAR
ncbi:MAG: hypothetical protein ABL964_07390 [Steroidobacteraceae bacterium]